MKQLFYFPLLLLFIIVGCSSDDSQPLPPQEKSFEQQLQAKWNMTVFNFYDDTDGELVQSLTKNGNCSYYGYIELMAGGKEIVGYYNAQNNCSEQKHPGTWTVDEQQREITLKIDQTGMEAAYKVISMDDHSMELQVIHEGGVKPSDSGIDLRVSLEK